MNEERKLSVEDFIKFGKEENWKIEREEFEIWLEISDCLGMRGVYIWDYIEREDLYNKEFERYFKMNEEEKENIIIEFSVRMVLENKVYFLY